MILIQWFAWWRVYAMIADKKWLWLIFYGTHNLTLGNDSQIFLLTLSHCLHSKWNIIVSLNDTQPRRYAMFDAPIDMVSSKVDERRACEWLSANAYSVVVNTIIFKCHHIDTHTKYRKYTMSFIFHEML